MQESSLSIMYGTWGSGLLFMFMNVGRGTLPLGTCGGGVVLVGSLVTR